MVKSLELPVEIKTRSKAARTRNNLSAKDVRHNVRNLADSNAEAVVWLHGYMVEEQLNASQIARLVNVDKSGLSRLFAGKYDHDPRKICNLIKSFLRPPSAPPAHTLAASWPDSPTPSQAPASGDGIPSWASTSLWFLFVSADSNPRTHSKHPAALRLCRRWCPYRPSSSECS